MAAMLTCLSGCQQSPGTQSVVSKNDGSFDKSVVTPATEAPDVGSVRAVSCTDEFTSTDNSVVFTCNISNEFVVTNTPVVEVVPHYLTEDDAKRVADVLLPDADWYKYAKEQEYTKEQIQEKINRWTQYASLETLLKLFGDSRDPESALEVVQGFLQDYSELYESAPSGPPENCNWTFIKDCFYYSSISEDEITEKDLAEANDKIQAVAKDGAREYTLSVVTRNKSDFKINGISLYLGAGTSPAGLDSRVYSASLCRTEAPTEEDTAAIAAKAQKMLDDMNLGKWLVESSSVQTVYYGDTPEYTINITAVPVINGIPAIQVPQIGNLKSKQSYASNYYFSEASFSFSPNGDLLSFRMTSPIDTKEILNENVTVKNVDELIELAKNHLKLSDYYKYGLSAETLDKADIYYGEKLTCHVELCRMEYGMLRVKVPNTDESYYYVPGIVLSGTVDYMGKDTGEILASSGESIWYDRVIPLVAINAVDGTNIELFIS